MKKSTHIVALLFALLIFSNSHSQDGTVVSYEGKVGVQSLEGEWIINPVYEAIEEIQSKETYYLLFTKQGNEYLMYDDFLEFDPFFDPLEEQSEFLIADSDFYVLSDQKYNTVEIINDESLSNHALLFLYHYDGMDLVNMDIDKFISFGYVSGLELFNRDNLRIMSSSGKYGIYDIKKDEMILETLYEDIHESFFYVDTNELDYEIDGFDPDLEEQPYIRSKFDGMVIATMVDSTAVYDLNSRQWKCKFLQGEFVNTLGDFNSLIYLISDNEVLYVNGELAFETGYFKTGMWNEDEPIFNSKYILVIDKNGENQIVNRKGEDLITSEENLHIENEHFFTKGLFNFEEPEVEIFSFDDPAKKLHTGDYVITLDAVSSFEYNELDELEYISEFLVVNNDGNQDIITRSGILIENIKYLWLQDEYLSIETAEYFTLIDLKKQVLFDIQSESHIRIEDDYLLLEKVFHYTNTKEGSGFVTERGTKATYSFNEYWYPKKYKSGWKMVQEDENEDGRDDPLTKRFYKDIDDSYSSDYFFVAAETESGWGVINYLEEVVVPFEYDEIELDYDIYEQPAFIVKKDGKRGFIDASGTTIIPVKYKKIETFPLLPIDLYADYYTAYTSKKKYEIYSVEGHLMFTENHLMDNIKEGSSINPLNDNTILEYEVAHIDGSHRLVSFENFRFYSMMDYNSRWESTYMLESKGMIKLCEKDGTPILDKQFKSGSKIIGDVVVEPLNDAYILYDFNGNRVNTYKYASVDIIDDAFLELKRDKGTYYMHFNTHEEISENDW